MKRQFSFFVAVVVTFLTILNCAKTGSPDGGPKDETPPVVEREDPPNGTVNFEGDRIRIYFDEFIKLNDVQKQLIVSPPLKNAAEISPQGSPRKYVEIKINDTLQANTTYVFNFGQSIVDNNENNPFEFYKYVFSTGDYIDSLTLGGMVQDALQKDPDQFISVMLYAVDSTYNDSIVYKKVPNYITNTLDSTITFQLTNIREGKYKLVAIKDDASNNLYEPKDDKIGFVEEEISIPTDSLYLVTLFKEILPFRATTPSLVSGNRIIFGYEGPVEKMNIKLLTQVSDSFDYKVVPDPVRDSLFYWFKGAPKDSIQFELPSADTTIVQTLFFKELANDTLVLQPNQSRTLSLKKPFFIQSTTPITSLDTTKITFFDRDSVVVPYQASIDSIGTKVDFNFERDFEKGYQLTLFPEAITDFFGETNDTLVFNLSTKKLADFGTLKVTLKEVESYPIIIQVTNESEEVVDELFVNEEAASYYFDQLDPATYFIRIIYDNNGNGTWDTGNYLKKIQPERIIYNPTPLEVRANWDWTQELTMTPKSFPDPAETEVVRDSI
ncbi:Ig-like domain-containing protein [Spongiivirga sp. MCCC 1A20706]|uniref:Ig-like domain-containing protein n=1 Tax=Spongiivirga sp. MCCC 1A20706 TaxID=3160963 RepID=UPI0039777C0D